MKKLLLLILLLTSVYCYGQSFHVEATDSTICKGVRVKFKAIHPDILWWNLQWQVNGQNVGGDSATYITDSLHDGDSVRCLRVNLAHTSILDSTYAVGIAVDTVIPDAGVITGVNEICPGASAPLSASVPGGIWGTFNGHATANGGMLTGISCNFFECPYDALDTVFYSVSQGFCSDTAFHFVTVKEPPYIKAELRSSWFCPFPPNQGLFYQPYCYSYDYSVLVDSSKYKKTYDVFCVSTTGCGSITRQVYPSVTFYTFVLDTPQISIASLQVCEGARVKMSAPEGPYKHKWSVYYGNAEIVDDSGSVYLVGKTAGTDILTLQYSNVCGNSLAKPDTVHVTVHPQPEETVYPRGVCVGQTDVHSDGVAGGIWTSSNLNVLTVDSLAGAIRGMTTGTATLIHVLPSGCEGATRVEVIDCEADISVFPVPATDNVLIRITSPGTYSFYSLVDAAGRSLLVGMLAGGYTKVDISMLPKGAYNLKILGAGRNRVFRLQKG
jgi:hypothetical protein